MEYHGAAEYFFWMGIEDAQIDSGADITPYVDTLINQGSKIATECALAFVLGFEFGGVLTDEDYHDLTKPVRFVETEEVYVEVDPDSIILDIDGNC